MHITLYIFFYQKKEDAYSFIYFFNKFPYDILNVATNNIEVINLLLINGFNINFFNKSPIIEELCKQSNEIIINFLQSKLNDNPSTQKTNPKLQFSTILELIFDSNFKFDFEDVQSILLPKLFLNNKYEVISYIFEKFSDLIDAEKLNGLIAIRGDYDIVEYLINNKCSEVLHIIGNAFNYFDIINFVTHSVTNLMKKQCFFLNIF